jgi:hypothetical protein
MVAFSTFEAEAPSLATLFRERYDATGLCLLGTIRADGYPRVSPLEPLLHEGDLWLGMMWQSRKALDLLREPRCTMATPTCDKSGSGGEVKLYGLAMDVQDPAERDGYAAALEAAIGFKPTQYHLFRIDITGAGSFRVVGSEHDVWAWTPGSAPVERHVPAPS